MKKLKPIYDPCAKLVSTEKPAVIVELADGFNIVANVKTYTDGRKELTVLGEDIKDFDEAVQIRQRYNTLNNL